MNRFLFFALLFFSFSGHAETFNAPKLFFEYSWLYDSQCAVIPEREIDPTWVKEVMDRESEFTRIWEERGPTLFGKVFELFGKGFQRKELTATLSVCPAPSYSNPLVINVNKYLKSYMKENPVRSDDSFADLIFHELLHTWVVENLGRPSPMLSKYRNEKPSVLAHLHLMAVQVYIYNQLNRPDLLAMIDQQYRAMNEIYQRSWEIVTAIEGFQPFIEELRD